MHTGSMRYKRGAALAGALFMLMAVLVVGVSAAGIALQAERAGRGARDRQLAEQAAEAALADAERDIDGAAGAGSERALRFAGGAGFGFAAHCAGAGDAASLGLCQRAPAGGTPVWQEADLSDSAVSVGYGGYTGASMQTGQGTLPLRLPRYIIEALPLHMPGEDASAAADASFYRITAIGYGARENTTVVLQSCYRQLASHGAAAVGAP